MQNEKPKKIEIVDVQLDVDLDAEIRKHSNIDAVTRTKISDTIEKARMRQEKPVDPEEQAWNTKFEALFGVMSVEGAPEITKEAMATHLSITVEQIGSAIAKFKKFLRGVKANQWVVLLDKNAKRERIYVLRRYA